MRYPNGRTASICGLFFESFNGPASDFLVGAEDGALFCAFLLIPQDVVLMVSVVSYMMGLFSNNHN